MTGKSIHELAIGDRARFTKTITESDVVLFAGVTGDFNPAHINESFAKQSRFERRIAHGMLSAGLISAVLGNHLPGPGSIYVAQTLQFKRPVYFNDTITAEVEVLSLDSERNRVVLRTVCTNQDGVLVLDGEATVMPPRR